MARVKYLIYYSMILLNKLMRFFRIFLLGFLLAVCIVLGVTPIIPKRKEQFSIEIKLEENDENKEAPTCFNLLEKK